MTHLDKNTRLIQLAERLETENRSLPFARQSEPQKVFSAIWELEAYVNGGGFDTYFRYTDSDTIAYAPIALQRIGASQCCEIVVHALNVLGDLPPMREPREDLVDGLGEDALTKLDEAFLAYPDDLTELLYAFVSRHAETFGPI